MKLPCCLSLFFTLTALPAQVDWLQESPATSPPARGRQAMAFDPIRGRTVLFGGNGVQSGPFALLADTWEHDGANWSQVATANSPPARQWSRMAFDPNNGVVLLFGGMQWNGQSFVTLADTWQFDGQAWTQLMPSTSPPSRASHGMVHDDFYNTVVVHGGAQIQGGTSVRLSDTWEWNGQTWTQLPTVGGPPAREGHGMVADWNGEIVVFGGIDGASARGDTWILDGVTWTQQTTSVAPPVGRADTMVFDPIRGRTVLWSGGTATWEWDRTQWSSRTTATAPTARQAWESAAVFDLVRGREVLFGGIDAALNRLGDTWSYGPVNPATATTFGTSCSPPGGPIFGVPIDGAPWVGGSMQLVVADTQPNAMVMVGLGVSNALWNSSSLPFDLSAFGLTGCQLLTSTDQIDLFLVPFGFASFTYPVPNDPNLVGTTVCAQCAAEATGANPANLVTMEGAALTVGSK